MVALVGGDKSVARWDMLYPCSLSYVRGHLFKMLNHVFQVRSNFDSRQVIAKSHSLEEFRSAVERVRDRYSMYQEGDSEFTQPEVLELFQFKVSSLNLSALCETST